MTKFLRVFLAVLVALGPVTGVFAAQPAQQYPANTNYGTQIFSFAAPAFNTWTASSSTTVAATSATMTVNLPLPNIPDIGQLNPFIVDNTLLIAKGTSVAETVTITAASCTSTACTFTATFASAHTGLTTIQSGSYGLNEAVKYVQGLGGGDVVIPTNFAGSTSTITGTAIGATTVSLVDKRAGIDSKYSWSGSAYVAYSAPITDNGSALQIVASSFLFVPTTNTGTTTGTPTQIVTLAAGAILMALTAEVTTTIPANGGVSSWSVADNATITSGVPIVYGTGLALTDGTELNMSDAVASAYPRFYKSATNLYVQAAGGVFPGTGAIRFTWYTLQAKPPQN